MTLFPHRRSSCALALMMTLLLVGCGSDSETTTAEGPDDSVDLSSDDQALTWYKDIKPLIDDQCTGCHVEGGVGPFELTSYEAFKPMAQAAIASIESGSMPPWMPDPDCREFRDERIVSPAQLDSLKAWVAEGMVVGNPDDEPARQEQGLTFEPTHTGAIVEAYTPSPATPDDYRCFILDFEFEQDTFLTGSQVIPDASALVHHVLVYAIGPEQLDTIEEADAQEAGSGYTCFGAPFPGTEGLGGGLAGGGGGLAGGMPEQVGAWVPGSVPSIMEDNHAIPIRAGSKIVMQVHYNMLAGDPEPDLTAFQMSLQTEPTDFVVHTRPLLIVDLEIPADAPEASNAREYRNYTDRTIRVAGLAAHMHLLGTRFKSEITRADGARECVLDIPEWDFSWQQNYRPPAGQTIDLDPGDAISIECVYDNSAANQPLVNGERVEPRDVTWGEGTLDEMCMMYISMVEPYEPPEPTDPNASVCDGASECLAACPEGASEVDCLLNCGLSTACMACSVREMLSCEPSCANNFFSLQSCFTDCAINTVILGGGIGECLQDRCGEDYDAMAGCIDPAVKAGTCDEGLAGCGITR